MKWMCFGGGAVDDAADETPAVGRRRRRPGLSFRTGFSSLKWKKSAGKKGSPEQEEVGSSFMTSSAASSVASSTLLSSSGSLESSSSSSSSAASSSSSSSSSFLEALQSQPRGSPAEGVAAVVVCLVVMVFCDRAVATLLTSTAMYLIARQRHRKAALENTAVCDVAWPERRREEAKRRVVMEGFLVRNRQN